MKIEVKQPSQNKSSSTINSQEIEQLVANILQKYLTSQTNFNNVNNRQQPVQQPQRLQTQKVQQQPNVNSNIFVVKSGMKSSYVALRVENILYSNKRVEVVGMGFAIPIVIDSILLAKKDMQKIGKEVNISLELFEKEVDANGKRKTVSGVKAILTL